MPTIGSLVVDLRAETAALRRDLTTARDHLGRIEKSMESLQNTAKGLGNRLLGFISAGVVMHQLSDAIQEAEQSQAKLDAVLKATGHSAGLTAGQINDLSEELKNTTLFDDEAVRNASAVLATFRNVQGDTFREGIRLAADMSAVMGQDLQSSVVQVGKALNDPVSGITALRRVGVQLNETQKETIKLMVETGNVAGAQQVILEELRKEFGGAAEGANTGLTGSLTHVRHAWDDMLESFGRLLGSGGVGPGITRFFSNLGNILDRVADFISPDVTPLEKARVEVERLGAAIADMEANPGSQRNKALQLGGITADGLRKELRYQEALVEILARRQSGEEAAATAAAAASSAATEADRLRLEASERARLASEAAAKAATKYWQDQATAIGRTIPDAVDVGIAAMKKLQAEIDRANKKAKPIPEEFAKVNIGVKQEGERAAGSWETAWKRAIENTQDTLADFLTFTQGKVNNLQSLLVSVLQTINRIAAQIAASKIIGAVEGIIGGVAGGGGGKGPGVGPKTISPAQSSASFGASGIPSASVVHIHLSPRIQVSSIDPSQAAAVIQLQGPTLLRMLKKGIREDPDLALMLQGR